MGKVYTASVIAKWIINKIHPEPLKLQKLLYLAQGYSYAFYDRPLFSDDMEGWVHGPVVPSVYRLYSAYSYNPISLSYEMEELEQEAIDVLNYVIEKYSKYDGKYLEELTHGQDPWILSREGLDPDERSDKTISKDAIANYFTNDVFQPSLEEWD
jgi:uncharacterized phage-associated protein